MCERLLDFGLDFADWAGVPLPRVAADDLGPLLVDLAQLCRNRSHREWPARVAVDEQPGVGVVAGQSHQVCRREVAAELLGENLCVLGAHLEAEQGSHVSEHGVCGVLVHLGKILIGDREIEPVLAGLGENRGEALGREVLELTKRAFRVLGKRFFKKLEIPRRFQGFNR